MGVLPTFLIADQAIVQSGIQSGLEHQKMRAASFPTNSFTISQSLKIRRSTFLNYIKLVNRRISRLWNCEGVGRVHCLTARSIDFALASLSFLLFFLWSREERKKKRGIERRKKEISGGAAFPENPSQIKRANYILDKKKGQLCWRERASNRKN